MEYALYAVQCELVRRHYGWYTPILLLPHESTLAIRLAIERRYPAYRFHWVTGSKWTLLQIVSGE